jgi:hypothetical protein
MSRPPDRFGRPFGSDYYGADQGAETASKPPDLFGRPWGDPHYGEDPASKKLSSSASEVERSLVKRVSDLESKLRKLEGRTRNIGTMRVMGGFSSEAPVKTHTASHPTFEDLGGANFTRRTLTKKYTETDLLVLFWVGGFTDAATTNLYITVQVDTTEHGEWEKRIGVTTHVSVAGFIPIGGAIAAADIAIELRVAVAGASNFRTNADDNLGWLALEVPQSLTFT